MKITIDTQADTYEDIRKVLHILSSILEKKGEAGTNFSESGTSTDTSNLMSMFGDNPSSAPNTPPDFSSFLNLSAGKVPEKKIERPQIQVY